MKRPIVGCCIAYSLGIGCCCFLSYWFLIVVGFLVLTYILFQRKKRFKLIILGVALFVFGFLYTSYLSKGVEEFNQKLLDYESVQGKYVVEKIVKTNTGYQITARLLLIQQISIHPKNKIKILLYCDDINDLSVSDCFVASGKIKKIEAARNPGGFNGENYYNARKIYFKSNIKEFQIIRKNQNPLLRWLSFIQSGFKIKIQQLFPENEAGIMNMMILGDSQDVAIDTKKMYQIGGISHLLAISGLHITFLGYCIYWGLRKFVKNIKISVVISLLTIWLYCLVTGGSSSGVRACLMFSLVLLSYIFGEKYDIYTSLSTAALIILLIHPLGLFDLGFQLSFMALFGIVSIKETMNLRFNPLENKVIELIFVTVSASLVTFPIIINSFNSFPTYSLIVNTCVVPSSSIMIGLTVIGIIISFLSRVIGRFIVGLVYFILKCIELICKIVEKLPFAYIVVKEMSWPVIILYFLAVFAIFSSRKYLLVRKFRFVPLVVLIIYLLITNILENNELKLDFLDVGQGDSCVIQYQKQVLIVDGGGLVGNEIQENTGTFILAPFLKSQGIQHVNGIFITHSDFDHIYGIIEIIDLMKIDFVALSIPYKSEKDPLVELLIEKTTEKNIQLVFLEQGQSYEWKDLKLQCMYPGDEKGFYPNNNSKSMVLKLSYLEFNAFLTGDIEILQEQEILDTSLVTDLSCEIMKVPHHGSLTSSSLEWVQEVNPAVAIFSYGVDNFYGHPADEVVERYEKLGVACFQTGLEGAILVKTDGKSYEVKSYINGRKEKFECKR